MLYQLSYIGNLYRCAGVKLARRVSKPRPHTAARAVPQEVSVRSARTDDLSHDNKAWRKRFHHPHGAPETVSAGNLVSGDAAWISDNWFQIDDSWNDQIA